MKQGQRQAFENVLDELTKHKLDHHLVKLWLAVFKASLTSGVLSAADSVYLLDFILQKAPWFDTKTSHFELLKDLEGLAFAAVSRQHETLHQYQAFLAQSLVPKY